MTFRPTFWPTVITVPSLIILVGLGVWQLQRHQEKTAMIAERSERTAAAPVALPGPDDDIAGLEFRRARATGTFLHDRELYLAARSLNGNPGYHVVTPLQLRDGRRLMVDRGWVPLDRKDPATRGEGQLAGPVTIDGVVRLPGRQNWLVPDNDPATNVWFWMDLPAMAATTGTAPAALAPVYLDAGPAANPGGYPLGGQTRLNLPNDHLQYAITWFLLAAALAVIYVVYHTRRDPPAKMHDSPSSGAV